MTTKNWIVLTIFMLRGVGGEAGREGGGKRAFITSTITPPASIPTSSSHWRGEWGPRWRCMPLVAFQRQSKFPSQQAGGKNLVFRGVNICIICVAAEPLGTWIPHTTPGKTACAAHSEDLQGEKHPTAEILNKIYRGRVKIDVWVS